MVKVWLCGLNGGGHNRNGLLEGWDGFGMRTACYSAKEDDQYRVWERALENVCWIKMVVWTWLEWMKWMKWMKWTACCVMVIVELSSFDHLLDRSP